MMKATKHLVVTALAGLLPLMATQGVISKEMTKPAGAAGSGAAGFEARSNQFWWPDQLDLSPLRDHDSRSNP
jgi:catalase-peroxidase